MTGPTNAQTNPLSILNQQLKEFGTHITKFQILWSPFYTLNNVE